MRRQVGAILLKWTDEWAMRRARQIPRDNLSDMTNRPRRWTARHNRMTTASRTYSQTIEPEATPWGVTRSSQRTRCLMQRIYA